jgi:hypothetical protein
MAVAVAVATATATATASATATATATATSTAITIYPYYRSHVTNNGTLTRIDERKDSHSHKASLKLLKSLLW